MRIAWYSNSPKHPSGYGTQTDLITRALIQAGHEVGILVSHANRDPLHQDEARRWIYPCGLVEHSQDTIGPYSRHFGADITVLFMDAWTHKPEMWGAVSGNGVSGRDKDFHPVLMFPVDHEPMIRTIVRPARKAWANITYSRHGTEAARQAGIESVYVPHACDTSAYYPMTGTTPLCWGRCEAREQVGIPTDRFVVGVVAANNDPSPTRKNWEGIIEGFRLFHADHPDSLLYIHTEMSGAYDIGGHLEDAGLGNATAFTDATFQRLGMIQAPEMNAIYNAFDVLLAPSRGEGFGLPLLEAQSAGTPVITGDWTATGELCFAGMLISRDRARAQRLTDQVTGCELYRWTAGPDAIAQCLKAMYEADEAARLSFRANARAGAMEYDIARVVQDFWLPTLAGFQERIYAENQQ